MGVNIHLRTREGREHPEWNSLRYAYDSNLAREIVIGKALPTIEWREEQDNEPLYRPADFDAWELFFAEQFTWSNDLRRIKLLQILKDEPDMWIRLSW